VNKYSSKKKKINNKKRNHTCMRSCACPTSGVFLFTHGLFCLVPRPLFLFLFFSFIFSPPPPPVCVRSMPPPKRKYIEEHNARSSYASHSALASDDPSPPARLPALLYRVESILFTLPFFFKIMFWVGFWQTFIVPKSDPNDKIACYIHKTRSRFEYFLPVSTFPPPL
jgi:hypothetical protein